METHERQLVVDQFNSSEARLEELVKGLSADQWTFREAPDRWSIAEVIEHVIAVEERITRRIAKILEGPGEPEKRAGAAGKDALVQSRGTDRSSKFNAPEPVRPTGKYESAELMAEFRKTRERTMAFVGQLQSDLRNHFIPHPVFGDLDCYQWLLLLGKHGDRHALQIEEIKANKGYPVGYPGETAAAKA